MRYLSIVKSSENQGVPPQALLDAIGNLTQGGPKDAPRVSPGGPGGPPAGQTGAHPCRGLAGASGRDDGAALEPLLGELPNGIEGRLRWHALVF